MSRKPETVFREDVVAPFLKTLNKTAFFPIQQLAIRGDADFIMCVGGWFVWLELKIDGGEHRELQAYKASCVRQCGGIVLIARPSNWSQIEDFLKLLNGGVYDKTALRGIKQNEFPTSPAKARKRANAGP